MGMKFPDNFLFFQPCLDIKYSFSDHAWTSNIIPTWWLVSWDLMWPIGGELVTTITSPSCWGTHFLYLSNPPSGNLLPIISCLHTFTRGTTQLCVYSPMVWHYYNCRTAALMPGCYCIVFGLIVVLQSRDPRGNLTSIIGTDLSAVGSIAG